VKKLLAWYRRVKRPMPWRLAPSPYVCWLSEIMLQQTTYEQALPYYGRFLKRFPTVEKLAAASEADVLTAWSGLGYYARARNLLAAARAVCASGRARWPKGLAAWAQLPGVGPYTAAALASVLDGEKKAVVDGNVARVFSRYWMLADDFKKPGPRAALAARLEKIMCGEPGDFNQAMMELGALVCTPKNPACASCPLASRCAARVAGKQEDFPARQPRKALPVRTENALVVSDGKGRYLLVENKKGGLLKGLWDFPVAVGGGKDERTFSHFKLVRTLLRAEARFVDPRTVPLTTSAKTVLASMRRDS